MTHAFSLAGVPAPNQCFFCFNIYIPQQPNQRVYNLFPIPYIPYIILKICSATADLLLIHTMPIIRRVSHGAPRFPERT